MGQIFISYATSDAAFASRVAGGLRRAGHRIFRDSDLDDGIAPGADWQRTLFRELRTCDVVVFLNSSASQESMWCHSELVVAIEVQKRVYSLDLAPGIGPHPLLTRIQGIRFETSIDASIRWLTESLGLDGLAVSSRPRWERGRPIYPGLAAMDVSDAGVFFGREAEVRDLMARVDVPLSLRDSALAVVMGPSGAGKSSLVRAGLAARLALPRAGWAVVTPFEPGARPLDRLVNCLAALVPGQLTEEDCRARLLDDGMAVFGEWLIGHARFPARRLLVTVDQFEQLAAVTRSEDCGEFLSVLGPGLVAGSPVTAVITVRSDRFDEVQRLPEIGQMIRDPYVVAPMSRSRLAAVIEGPAACADLAFAPGLTGRLVDDATRGSRGEAVDALPFLAFALREMYDLLVDEERATFTESDYERVGGLEGSILRRTEAVEALLAPGSGPILDRLLQRFVTLDEDHPPAGRPLARARLTTAEQDIVGKLEDQRLLTGDDDTIRLAHEQLIVAWPRLAQAIADSRDDLLLQARLGRQARDWKQGNGQLLGRDAAAAGKAWLAERAEPGTDRSRIEDYVRASWQALRRRKAQVVGTISVVIALALAASVIAVIAEHNALNANRQHAIALSRQLIADSLSIESAEPVIARQLAVAAWSAFPTDQAGTAISTFLTEQRQNGILPADPNSVNRFPVSLDGDVNGVAFSPDGKMLASADGDGTVRLWNPATDQPIGSPLQTGINSGRGVNGVAFSPDAKMLASADSDGTVRLWNPVTGQPIGSPLQTGAVQNGVNGVAFSPDGKMLASADSDGTVRLWNPVTGQPLGSPQKTDAPGGVSGLAFSPDGKMLASADGDGTVRLWNPITGRPIGSPFPRGAQSGLNGVTFSPDGKILATAVNDGTVRLWNPATGRPIGSPIQTGAQNSSGVTGVAFSPDGKMLATASDITSDSINPSATGTVRVWNLATGRPIGSPLQTVTEYGVSGVAFSPDGKMLASADGDGTVRLSNPATGQPIGSPLQTVTQGGVSGVAFSPDGKMLASADSDGTVRRWNPATGRPIGSPLQTGAVHNFGGVTGVAFSPDGKMLASAGADGTVRRWNPATGRPIGSPLRTGYQTGVNGVAFSPDGKMLASADRDGTVRRWNPATGQLIGSPLQTGVRSGRGVSWVAFSPDGKMLATASNSAGAAAFGTVRLWNPATGQPIGSPLETDVPNGVNGVAFSPDGKMLAAYGPDIVRLWNPDTGQPIGSSLQTNYEGDGTAVAFSPDGKMLAAYGGGTVWLWNPDTGQPIGSPLQTGAHTGWGGVAFSPDSKVLATVDSEGGVLTWETSLFAHPYAVLCSDVGPPSAQDWQQYAPGEPEPKVCT